MHRRTALALRGLSKRFDRPAVEALDLTVYGGEFYALVGPNGAGKTTTLRMVVGLMHPDSGSICINGIDALADPVAAKQVTAWLSDEPMIYDKLTPFEYLEFVAGLWRIDARAAEANARELLDWLGLMPHAHERCEGFSRGMKQKVALAGALVHDPQLIILDEPFTGLDAGSARQVKNVLPERVDAGGTVIMTTHILEVAERMADRIGVIAHGRLIAEGTLDELHHMTGKTAASLEETFSRWWPTRSPSRERARHIDLARRARAAPVLARLADADDGRPSPPHAHAGDRALLFAAFMHLFAYWMVKGYADANIGADTATLVGITGTLVLSWSLLLSQAMESVTRLSQPLRSRSQSLRAKFSPCAWRALPSARCWSPCCSQLPSSTCWPSAAAVAGWRATALSPAWAR